MHFFFFFKNPDSISAFYFIIWKNGTADNFAAGFYFIFSSWCVNKREKKIINTFFLQEKKKKNRNPLNIILNLNLKKKWPILSSLNCPNFVAFVKRKFPTRNLWLVFRPWSESRSSKSKKCMAHHLSLLGSSETL